MNVIVQQLYHKLEHVPLVGRSLVFLVGVTSAARYWYVFLGIGILTVSIGVVFAVSFFVTMPGIPLITQTNTKQTLTISKKKINDMISIYKMKQLEFIQAQKKVPQVIDPGR